MSRGDIYSLAVIAIAILILILFVVDAEKSADATSFEFNLIIERGNYEGR